MALISNASYFVKIKKVEGLLEDQEACGINSILTLIKGLFPKSTITVEELKEIFDFDDEGIRRENYRFNKLNQRLSQDNCPFKIRESKFSSVKELFQQLSINVPVPIIMGMEIIEQFKEKFDYPHRKFNWGNPGDLFRTYDPHIMVLVGYEESGEKLYFIDPSYQLPYLTEQDLNRKTNLLELNARDFYQYVRSHYLFMEVKYSKRLKMKVRRKANKETQKTLS